LAAGRRLQALETLTPGRPGAVEALAQELVPIGMDHRRMMGI
jgi:hypothetical protein